MTWAKSSSVGWWARWPLGGSGGEWPQEGAIPALGPGLSNPTLIVYFRQSPCPDCLIPSRTRPTSARWLRHDRFHDDEYEVRQDRGDECGCDQRIHLVKRLEAFHQVADVLPGGRDNLPERLAGGSCPEADAQKDRTDHGHVSGDNPALLAGHSGHLVPHFGRNRLGTELRKEKLDENRVDQVQQPEDQEDEANELHLPTETLDHF